MPALYDPLDEFDYEKDVIAYLAFDFRCTGRV